MEVLRWEVWGNPRVWRVRGSREGRRESFEVETWEGEAAWLPMKNLKKDQPGEQKVESLYYTLQHWFSDRIENCKKTRERGKLQVVSSTAQV